MLNRSMTKGKKILALVLILLVVLSTLFASLAFFTDRANKTTTIQISTFNDDGYTIEQLAPDGWFVAGETFDVQIKESNDKEENITSQITMHVRWDSPVSGVYPWGNDGGDANAVLSIGNESIPYITNGDTITFTLPEKLLTAKTTGETLLEFQIPSELASTGRLYFSYDRIVLSQYPSGWTAEYDGVDLTTLSFDVGVAWNISSNQSTKDVIAYLTDGSTAGDTNYGLSIVKAGSDANTNQGIMLDWSRAGETPWADYSITELSIGERVTTIGDYAFAGETGITSVTIPSTVTDIGISAFDGAGLTGSLSIPATVEFIDSLAFGNLQAVTAISFGHSNTDPLTLADNSNATFGAFYAGSPYTPTNPLGTTILSNKDDILNYAWNLDARGYTVTVNLVTGASVSAVPTTAIPGRTIQLTAVVNDGYAYNGSTLTYGSDSKTLSADELSFLMPAANVVVSPQVSLIPYTITYELNGGTLPDSVPTEFNVTTDTFSLPEPTRPGYTFDGWYEDSAFAGDPVTELPQGTTGDKTYYAKWTANPDTPYVVHHWQQKLAGGSAQNSTNYTLKESDYLTGTTDTKVTPARKSYEGFTAPAGVEITISGDGSTVLNYYYTRNSYTFTLGSDTGASTSDSTPTGSYRYGTTITLSATADPGYRWIQWISSDSEPESTTDAESSFSMPARDITMNPSVDPIWYTITYVPNGGTIPDDAPTGFTVESATLLLPTNPTKTGYIFAGWYVNSDLSGTSTAQISAGSIGNRTFYAKWDPYTETPYTVCHWTQNLDGGEAHNDANYTCVHTESLTGSTGTVVTLAVRNYVGFTAPTPQTVTIAADGSTVVNYYYTRNSYTFTLGTCNGVVTTGSTPTGSYKYGYNIVLSATANSGYTWSLWISSDADLQTDIYARSSNFSMPAGDLTMTPSATLNTYTITYETNDGTLPADAVTRYTVETATFSLPTPTKTGYTFAGWYSNEDLSGDATVQIEKGSTGNKKFYAKWTASTGTIYTVHHWKQNLANDEYTEVTADKQVLTGTTGASVTPAVKSYTGFSSPSTQTVTIAADGSTVVNYYYTRNSYTFTLKADAGVTTTGSSSTGTYKYGATITLAASAKNGYTWNGWTSSNTSLVSNPTQASSTFSMPNGNITMTASASVINYDITYELNGGTQGSGAVESYTVESSTITLPTPTKTGYTFAGWYENSTLSGTAVTQIAAGSTGDKTFYAKWTANSGTAYTVKHYQQNLANDNYTLKETENKTGTTGESVTPVTKTYTGFTSPSTQTVTIAADGSTVVNYYYTRNSYTFTLGTGTGVTTTGSTASGSYKYGATITLKAAANTGYTWSKWTSSTTLVSGTSTANTTFNMPAGSVTMTPSATLNTYTITYELNGGTQGSGAVTSYNVTTATFSLPTPTKTGYTFGGWYTSSSFSGSVVTQIAKGSTGNKTFYAKWNPSTDTAYTVKHYQENAADSGYTLKETENKTGTTGASVTPAVKSYTGFTSPSTHTVTIAADGSTVVEYYYTRNTYQFTLGTGTGITTTGSTATGYYKHGVTITLKATANTGYTWTIWTSSSTNLVASTTTANTTFTMPIGNITMTPSATLNTYTISYELNGGTQGSGAVTSYNVTTATFSLPTPTRTGYTFAGWYTSSTFSGSAVTQIAKGSTGDKTFYAKWTANSGTAYTVKHYQQNLANDNYTLKETENKTGTTGESVTPATKTYTGFTSPSTQTVTIAADGSTVVNYYYTRNSYTFTLGTGTGVTTTGSTASGSYKYGATITLKAAANTGYTWSKWTSSTTLVSGTSTANTTFNMPAGSVTMTPSATLNTYTITYELNGGTQGSGAVTSYNVTTATFSLPTPTKTGYTFGGWYTSSSFSGSAVTQIAKGSTGNKTFYAKWTLPVPILAPKTTWFTRNTFSIEKSSITTITFVNLVSDATVAAAGEYVWDASAAEDGSVMAYAVSNGDGTYALTVAGNGYGKIFANAASNEAFYYFSKVTAINNLSLLDTQYATTMVSMFAYCKSMTSAPDTSNWDTSAVTNMKAMFKVCSSMTEAPDTSGWDTSNVTNMSTMFDTCSAMATAPATGDWNTSKVTTMSSMFSGCSSMVSPPDTSEWNTGLVSSFSNMFYYCSVITTPPDTSNWDVESATSTWCMFQTCSALTSPPDTSNWVTTALTNVSYMFDACKVMTSAPVTTNWDTDLITTTAGMFRGCVLMQTTIDTSKWVTTSLTTTAGMFNKCKAMATAPVLTSWDTSKVTSMTQMFYHCESIASLDVSTFDTSSITSSSGLANFAAFCYNLTEITLGSAFVQSENVPIPGVDAETDGAAGLFAVDSRSKADPLRTTVTGANAVMLAYEWGDDYRGFVVDINPVTGGTLSANKDPAINGVTVTITTSANGGYTYGGATISYTLNGTAKTISLDSSTTSFTMPAADVTITPIWTASTSTSSVSAVSADVIMTVDTIPSPETTSENLTIAPDTKQILADSNPTESNELPPQVPEPVFIPIIEVPIVPIYSATA